MPLLPAWFQADVLPPFACRLDFRLCLSCRACSEWGVEDRCALLRLLCSLCAESTRLHNKLMGEEDEVGGWLLWTGLDLAGVAGSATPPEHCADGCPAAAEVAGCQPCIKGPTGSRLLRRQHPSLVPLTVALCLRVILACS